MSNVRSAVSNTFDRHFSVAQPRVMLREKRADGMTGIIAGAHAQALAPHFEIQEALRPLFGKGEPVAPSIGDHPDFNHLRDSLTTEFAPITTLFTDIIGSTRLSLHHDPETVYRFKNAVIRSAIDIIKSFDGHVHRIMGDAVMAYFGRRGEPVEVGALDAINCAAALQALVGELMARKCPELNDENAPGIRIGLDHGSKDKVLWGLYGYPGVEEVTATSFFVDVAAKLQQAAARNQILVGQSLRDLLDIPDDVLDRRRVISAGNEVEVPFVEPNYTGPDGKPVNYRQFVLDGERYLRWTRLGPALLEELRDDESAVGVDLHVADDRESAKARRYQPCSAHISKGRHIRFDVSLKYQPQIPFTVSFEVENHGQEAGREANCANHTTQVEKTRNGDLTISHWEGAQYRGLHYMTVKLVARGKARTVRRGVWVE